MKQRPSWRRPSWRWVGPTLLLVAAAGAGNQDGAAAPARRAAGPAPAALTEHRAEAIAVGESLPPPVQSSRAAASDAVTAAGVRAFIDPETGKLTANPTRAQLQRLALERRSPALQRSTIGLRPFDLARGGRGVNLQGRFQTALSVERAADGSFRVTCGDLAENGEAHSHAPAEHDGLPASTRSEAVPEQ